MPVTPTIFDDNEFKVLTWASETGTGLKGDVAGFPDVTIQATGTGTVTVEGSMDGTNWVALNATGGSAISLDATTNAMAVILEHPVFIRPVVATGTATVTALASGNR